MKRQIRVFMGGTCEGYNWRRDLVAKTDKEKVFCFNPVVENWNEEARQNEIKERESCDLCLYVITPFMAGCYSIAEVIDDSNKRPEKTVLIVLDNIKNEKRDNELYSYTPKMAHSLEAVKDLVRSNGAKVFNNLDDFAKFLPEAQILV